MKLVLNDGGRSKYFKATEVRDCVVRAIAIATGKNYKEVYDELKALNKGKSCRNGTPKSVSKKYLTQLGWTWNPCMTIGSGCQVHLNEDELPKGTLIVSVSKHLTCVKDGVIYDTYDCSRGGTRCVYGYWTPPQCTSGKPKFKVGDTVLVDGKFECMVKELFVDNGIKYATVEPVEFKSFYREIEIAKLVKL